MIPRIALYACLAFVAWFVYRDTKARNGVSVAVWIPTLWLGIIASRPLSTWLGGGFNGDFESSLEGSPVDALFDFAMILGAIVVLARRRLNGAELVSRNWAIFLFYGYL